MLIGFRAYGVEPYVFFGVGALYINIELTGFSGSLKKLVFVMTEDCKKLKIINAKTRDFKIAQF